ncbi:MAG: hypothetical protein HY934_10410 [Candidatus Firestonebacteria bacterium]|nr:hypothetical protein [Candidatus Firestonebacteria bacterium]
MFKKVLTLIFVLTIFVLNNKTIFATASTHIWAPATDIQAYKKWHLTSDYYGAAEKASDGTRPVTITNLGLTIGILPYEKINAEVGFDHKTGYGALDDYPIYFNAKVGVTEKAYGEFFPALAAGIFDIGTKKDLTDADVYYGKLAKTFEVNKISLGRFSLGYFSGNEKILTSNGDKDNTGALICLERTITEISDKLWIAVDYQGSKSAYGALNYGFSWKFSDNTSVIFAYDDYNNDDFANTFTVQTDIDF